MPEPVLVRLPVPPIEPPVNVKVPLVAIVDRVGRDAAGLNRDHAAAGGIVERDVVPQAAILMEGAGVGAVQPGLVRWRRCPTCRYPRSRSGLTGVNTGGLYVPVRVTMSTRQLLVVSCTTSHCWCRPARRSWDCCYRRACRPYWRRVNRASVKATGENTATWRISKFGLLLICATAAGSSNR